MSGAQLWPHDPVLAAAHDRMIAADLERCTAYLHLVTSTAKPAVDLVRCLDTHLPGHEYHHGITMNGEQVKWSMREGRLRYTGTEHPADQATGITVHEPSSGVT